MGRTSIVLPGAFVPCPLFNSINWVLIFICICLKVSVGALRLITIQISNMNVSSEILKLTATIALLAKKLESQEHLISRDLLCLRENIASKQLRIDISLDAISKSLGVLHQRIESTVERMETIMSLVNVPVGGPGGISKDLPDNPEMLLPEDLLRPWNEDERAWLNSIWNDPVPTSSIDLSCSETISAMPPPSSDLMLKYGGTTVNPEQVSHAGRTKSSRKRTLKNPEQSGGMDICYKHP